ncbi:hypothetical protein EXIGLDRAFT_718876 [Exidia glandulosa HHB12029]|uniref:F-box domain-containing protein n=1 Tax=Exidia glandulosa HHB12029 TaxID=1314781 RepID=A0A165HEE7_EXIGL|nr:hypothetical protein EXIGLDRAFT_718876 [Exidia glandulosa HHB12029]
MSSFEALPYDVLEIIARYLARTALAALCITTRALHSLALPLLYRVVELSGSGVNSRQRYRLFLRTVGNSDTGTIALLVTSFSLDCRLEQQDLLHVVHALRAMQNLRHLYVRDMDATIRRDVSTLDAVKALQHLRTIRIIIETDSTFARLVVRLPPMESLHVEGSVGSETAPDAQFDRLVLWSVNSLVRLRMLSTYYCHDLLCQNSSAIWERVKELGFGIPANGAVQAEAVAHAFPNVEWLETSLHSEAALRLICDLHLPHLRQLKLRVVSTSLYSAVLPMLAQRKRSCTIPHLAVLFENTELDLDPVMGLFQSQALRTLQLRVERLTPSIKTILEQCPNLHYIGLILAADRYHRGLTVSAFETTLEIFGDTPTGKLDDVRYISVALEFRKPSHFQHRYGLSEVADEIYNIFAAFRKLRALQLGVVDEPWEWRRHLQHDDGLRPPSAAIHRVPCSELSLPYTIDGVVRMVDDDLRAPGTV